MTEFRRNPFSGPPPRPNETAEQRRQREAFELFARVPRNYNAESLTLSPAATPSTAAGRHPRARCSAPACAAKRLFFDETNRGFLGRDVGYYDRSDAFTLDFWFYVGRRLRQRARTQPSGRAELGPHGLSAHDRRRQALGFARALPSREHDRDRDRRALPVGEWTHITLTYDGSSRAAGLQLYLNGAPAATRTMRDSLTRSILPFTSADVFDPFLGLAVGTRFREKAPVGSGIDELRVFERDLTPVEIAFLHDETLAASACLETELAELLTATDARSSQRAAR